MNDEFLKAVKSLFGGDRELEISIHPKGEENLKAEETGAQYLARLKKATSDVDEGKVVRFTAEEFEALAAKLQG